ncbi:MAG: hypothetical protein IJN75_00710 [Clostridia bacterium]|nr:hypothetical protein [Clostridia bacterium]
MNKLKYRITIGVYSFVAVLLGFLRVTLTRRYAVSVGVSELATYDSIRLSDNPKIAIFTYLVLAMLVIAGIVALISSKTASDKVEYTDIASVFSSSLCAFMMLTTAAFQFYYYFSGKEYSVLEWAIACLLILASAFFWYASSKAVDPRSPKFTLLSVLPLVWAVLRVLEFFIKIHIKSADTNELFHLFSLCTIMLFFLEEGKFSLGFGNKKAYVFYGLCAVVLTMVYALPHALLAAFWVVNFSMEAICSCLELIVVVFIISRLFNYPRQSSIMSPTA